MARKYFGTDGIRGRANGVITPDLALKVGQATGLAFHRGDHRHRVVIGKDTRLSGYMIEYAMVAGFTAVGMDVMLLGPMPTPAVAMLTRSMRADLGVMISASHNPYEDNGIKLFGPDGYKLNDEVEHDLGIGLCEGSELRRQHQVQRGARHGQPEIAGRSVPRLDRRFQRQVDFGQCRPQPLEQASALLGWRDRTGAARQQPHAEPGFQAGDGMADR